MNRIVMMAAIAVMGATTQAHAQNMIDPVYNSAPPQAEVRSGVYDMNPSFNPYVGPSERNRSQVSAVQAELQARGYKLKIDGDYGPKTRAAVKKFQRANGLRVDGVLGPQTLGALGFGRY